MPWDAALHSAALVAGALGLAPLGDAAYLPVSHSLKARRLEGAGQPAGSSTAAWKPSRSLLFPAPLVCQDPARPPSCRPCSACWHLTTRVAVMASLSRLAAPWGKESAGITASFPLVAHHSSPSTSVRVELGPATARIRQSRSASPPLLRSPPPKHEYAAIPSGVTACAGSLAGVSSLDTLVPIRFPLATTDVLPRLSRNE
ncbi:hypothetical protein Micbo1qcDRAFT_180508 [Microdochium bolleyi]|uniref:Uncharacterized protein n=1 Tax=Microdochium bolleyi TaxID=196109 RepID=A0A136ILW7_9PEZI|nr:hypothetical protein Micbo1qcDRAFT_180508 [Microdochium bolleyi]